MCCLYSADLFILFEQDQVELIFCNSLEVDSKQNFCVLMK